MKLLAFYTGTGSDHQGRTLDDIRNFSRQELEIVHDYIQWLFPLEVPSRFNPMAPCLTPREIAEFRRSPILQEQLIGSLHQMLFFFGFTLSDDGDPHVAKSPDHSTCKKIWLKSGNHNCLRISRMLRSLSILGLRAYSEAFFLALQELAWYERWRLGPDTYRRWKDNLG